MACRKTAKNHKKCQEQFIKYILSGILQGNAVSKQLSQIGKPFFEVKPIK
jgi:hypothetical protein